MDPMDLRDAARARGCDVNGEASAWLAAVEQAAAAHPEDAGWAGLILAFDDEGAVRSETPVVVAGVRRERLVRFDALSSTWTGTRAADGATVLVRAPRDGLSPAARRVLDRELTRVAGVAGATLVDGAAVLVATGWPASAVRGEAVARVVGDTLVGLDRFRAALGSLPAIAEDELRWVDGRIRLCALSMSHEDPGPRIVLRLIDPDDTDELSVALRGTAEAGGTSADLAGVLRDHLVQRLVARRHDLAERWRAGRRRWTEGRLLHAVRRLQAAMPPPTGRGALGVDLEGRILVLGSDPVAVHVGADDEREVVWDVGGGLRPAGARRVLRLRASAMPNPTLDARVGGTPGHVDAVCRWLGASIDLRTLTLLLEHGVGA
ncbi:MAG: hypothetical protein H6738_08370 [Alphaproteobacteria bacterium]|nr:hypothetical protein [Alphaproteobacteria bacterium]MCB9696775.1 hypothetical protein [Alphaproteobacteria bacterium]